MPITNMLHVKSFFSEPKCDSIEVVSISGLYPYCKR